MSNIEPIKDFIKDPHYEAVDMYISGLLEEQILELVDNIEGIESYFAEAPIDYGDRKDGFEKLLHSLLTSPDNQ